MADGFDPRRAYDLGGRVIIVTGGGTGIGMVYSQILAEAGAKVVLADLAAEEGDRVAQEIRESGGEALSITTDVKDEVMVENMVNLTMKKFGQVNGLINNASMMSVLPRGDWFNIPPDEWDSVMQVNLKGIFLCCRAVYPHMKVQGGGGS